MAPLRDRIFYRITKLSCTRYQYLLLAVLFLGAFSAILITRLQFQSNVVNLLPANAPTTGAFVKFLREFGTSDSLYIVLERRSGGEMESFSPFAEALAEQLAESGEFSQVVGRIDPASLETIGRLLIPKALLYLTETELKEMGGKLTPGAIRRRVQALKASLYSPLGSLTSQVAVRDPLDIWPLFQKHLPLGLGEAGMNPQGVLLSPDRKMMLLIAKPRGSAPDIRYDEFLLKKLQTAVRAAQEATAREQSLDSEKYFSDLQIGFAGGYISALEDSRMIRKDLIMNFSVSLIGVMLLVGLAFKTASSIFYTLVPLIVSPLLTIGLFSPFLGGRLSESTGAFSAIILGLSVDFIILIYGRYLEERNHGQIRLEALGKSLTRTGPGVFTGGVTTTAAYFALLFSDFRGVKELGFLTGTGILLSLLCAFFLFPALVSWREKKKETKKIRTISSFGLERISPWALKRPAFIFTACSLITLGAMGWAFEIKINNDPRRLRPPHQVSLILQERVQEKMGEGQETIVILNNSRGEEETLEVQGKIKNYIDTAMTAGLPLSGYESLAEFLPPFSRQKRNLGWIFQNQEILNPDRIENQFREMVKQEGLRIEPFAPGLKTLRRMLTNRDILTWSQFSESPLGELGIKFLKRNGNIYNSAAYLQTKPDFWTTRRGNDFLQGLKTNFPNLQLTGSKLVQKELENTIVSESRKVILIALIAVFSLLYFDFRSLKLALLSLLPVALASLWTLGIMVILGMELNFLNLVVFTMVIGVGVDYGVHIIHRRLESGNLWEEDSTQVGKGVILAALTTLVGFGSLVTSSFPGLQSMGAVALMGVGFSALIALTLLPVLLRKSR